MITEFLLSIPAFILQAFLAIIPNGGSIPTEWSSSVFLMWGYVNQFSFILPINTIVTCLGIVMTYHLTMWGWDALVWILARMRS